MNRNGFTRRKLSNPIQRRKQYIGHEKRPEKVIKEAYQNSRVEEIRGLMKNETFNIVDRATYRTGPKF